ISDYGAGFLSIRFMTSLTSLEPLSNLSRIGGYVYVDNNENLESLQALENVDITEVNHLEITNNTDLSYCHTPNLCSYLSDFSNYRLIENNVGNCINAPAVYDSCGIEMSTQDYNYLETHIYTDNNTIF